MKIRIQTVFLAILSLNVIGVLILGFNQYEFRTGGSSKLAMLRSQESYRFTNPAIALELLEELDVFSTVDADFVKKANFTAVDAGFRPNWKYCEQHRELIVKNPEIIFEKNNIISNSWKKTKIRTQVIPLMGAEDLHPEVHRKYMPKNYKFDMRLDANVFFMVNRYFNVRQVGKQFSCLSQASNHIPGHDKIYRKDRVGQALVDYSKLYVTRPQCFNSEKWFPKTWVLREEDQCKDFFLDFMSPRYQKLREERNIVYFRKIGANVHEGKGVFPVTIDEEKYIKELYGNGDLCGEIRDNNIIQYNVHNLFLLDGHKFHFRTYMLVASTNPLLAYYHDGYLRLSLSEYDPKSQEKGTFITNIGPSLESDKFKHLSHQEIEDITTWSLLDFQNHLIKIGRTTDEDYLHNTLRPELKKVMIHLLRMGSSGFQKMSSLFELYGLDFIMDDNLDLWFIEANTMPLINGFTKETTLQINTMLIDMFEIVRGLLKSRMKRVIVYINELTKEVEAGSEPLVELDERREEFRALSQNYFEPEFEISKSNTFEKIIDDLETGTKRYSYLITEECL